MFYANAKLENIDDAEDTHGGYGWIVNSSMNKKIMYE